MQTWTFNLEQETRPIMRAGFHGLWRLLTYGEHHPRYPDIRQSETLKWKLTNTTVTIDWESYEDLHLLMNCMLGDFHHGIAVPPGYETDPNREGFCVTVRQHQGIVSTWRTKSGKQFRSVSLGGETPKKKVLRRDWTRDHGHKPITEVELLPESDSEKPLTITVSPHMRAKTLSLITVQPPSHDVAKKGPFKPQPIRKFTTATHPALASWNKQDVKATTQEIFIASFSCLSYIFTMSEDGLAGLAVDARTFTESDQYHREWSDPLEPKNVLWVSGNAHTAFWVMASSIDLPAGTYAAITARGSSLFYTESFHAEARGRIYRALGESIEETSKNRYLRRTRSIPVSNRVATKGGSDSKRHMDLYLDRLVTNLESGVLFCVGMDGIHTVVRGKTHTGLYPKEREIITTIGLLLMTDIEKEVSQWMRNLYCQLAFTFLGDKPNPSDGAKHHAWDQARAFAINTHLTRAANRHGILDAVNAITKKVGRPHIPANVYEYIWDRAWKNPGEVRAMLIMACGLALPVTGQPDKTK